VSARPKTSAANAVRCIFFMERCSLSDVGQGSACL
jgi:hypothetical protein